MIPFVSSLVTTLNNCDSTDYSPIIKKVAIPMQTKLEAFYSENKRFPTGKERNEMLEKVGCLMDGGVCIFELNRIILKKSSLNSYTHDYEFWIKLGKTGCQFGIEHDGDFNQVTCGNSPCIKLGQ